VQIPNITDRVDLHREIGFILSRSF